MDTKDLLDIVNSGVDLTHNEVTVSPVDLIRESLCSQQEVISSIAERNEEGDRRYDELISAIKEAGEKGATIVVGNNAMGVQIQNNSSGANQTMNVQQTFDYSKASDILNEIKEYFEYDKFSETFGDNAENVRNIVEESLMAISNHEDERLIKKSLNLLKDLAIGAGSSLIASGILALLNTLPI